MILTAKRSTTQEKRSISLSYNTSDVFFSFLTYAGMLYTIRRRRLLLLLLATRQAMFKTHSPPRKRDSDQGSFVTYSGGLVDFLRGIDSTQPLTTNTASLTREPSKPHVLLHVPMMLFCRAQSSLCGCISAPLGNYIHKPNKQKKI